jgi:hypothetical protein
MRKAAMADNATTNREGVRRYRERQRERGLRPVQIWVPDVGSPQFHAEARRQSMLVGQSPHAAEDQAFVDDLADGAW